jgi:hypothetical protein
MIFRQRSRAVRTSFVSGCPGDAINSAAVGPRRDDGRRSFLPEALNARTGSDKIRDSPRGGFACVNLNGSRQMTPK